MKALRIDRTIRVTTIVPFSDKYYPDMTIEQAIDYERELELSDAIEALVGAAGNAEFNVKATPMIHRPAGELNTLVTAIDIELRQGEEV